MQAYRKVLSENEARQWLHTQGKPEQKWVPDFRRAMNDGLFQGHIADTVSFKSDFYKAVRKGLFRGASLDNNEDFLQLALARVDPTLHNPQISFTWNRDIKVFAMPYYANVAYYYLNTFGAPGANNVTGKSWWNQQANALPRVNLQRTLQQTQMLPWANSIVYTDRELEQARHLDQPLDAQYLTALKTKYEYDVDNTVYLGDVDFGFTGLLNSDAQLLAQGGTIINTTSTPIPVIDFSTATPDQILAIITELCSQVNIATSLTHYPTRILMSNKMLDSLATRKVSEANPESILTYLINNLPCGMHNGGKPMEFFPVKWLDYIPDQGLDAFPEGRMVAYTPTEDSVRYPLYPVQRMGTTPNQLQYITPYVACLGVLQILYPTRIGYADGIGLTASAAT